MFLHETVQRCSRCEEVTPHSRRAVAIPMLLSSAALVGAGWCFIQDMAWWLLGGLLLIVATFSLLHDREKYWGVHCERCRGKAVAALRRTKPTLDGYTMIDFF